MRHYQVLIQGVIEHAVGFAIPTREALDAIVKHASTRGIVEMGAGTGFWAAMLRNHGANVLAFDRDPPDADESGNHWIMMPNGAHHLDLRAPHDDDPADVTAARKREEAIIWGWITDYAGKGTAATAMAKKKKKSKPVESAESPS